MTDRGLGRLSAEQPIATRTDKLGAQDDHSPRHSAILSLHRSRQTREISHLLSRLIGRAERQLVAKRILLYLA